MEIPDRLARVVFDVAVSSADFGSGFLDDEEVEALRELAVLLGVDPMDATPGKFACFYRGHHQAEAYLGHEYVTGPDGIMRNAYLRVNAFPEDVRGKLKRIGTLGMLVSPTVRMHCGVCGQDWAALDSPPRLRP